MQARSRGKAWGQFSSLFAKNFKLRFSQKSINMHKNAQNTQKIFYFYELLSKTYLE